MPECKTFHQKLEVANQYLRANGMSDVIWLCTPYGLPFFSAKQANLTWWSLKWHPTMPFVSRRITAPQGKDDQFEIAGLKWLGFTEPYSYENQYKAPIPFEARDHALGAFCRETMLDNPAYWSMVKACLSDDPHLTFQYAGKEQVHQKWIAPDDAIHQRIVFLGWLSNPARRLRKVKALLDPPSRGHGLMMREAVYAGVPIIFCKDKNGEMSVIQQAISRAKERGVELNEKALGGFTDTDSLRTVTKNLCTQKDVFEAANREMVEKLIAPQDDWNKLVTLLRM